MRQILISGFILLGLLAFSRCKQNTEPTRLDPTCPELRDSLQNAAALQKVPDDFTTIPTPCDVSMAIAGNPDYTATVRISNVFGEVVRIFTTRGQYAGIWSSSNPVTYIVWDLRDSSGGRVYEGYFDWSIDLEYDTGETTHLDEFIIVCRPTEDLTACLR